MLVLFIVLSKVYSCINRCCRKHSLYQRVDVGVEHPVSWFATNFLSQIREDFLEISHVRYPEIVRPSPASIYLGLVCRHKSPCAPVEIGIRLPRLKARGRDFIRISCQKFPP